MSKGAGRPVGSVQTAGSIIRAELKANASTMAKARGLMEEQINEIRKKLSSDSVITLSDRLSTLDTLTGVIEKLQKTSDGAVKFLATEGKGVSETAEVDVSKVIASLTGEGE
jgi:hypothetical protein